MTTQFQIESDLHLEFAVIGAKLLDVIVPSAPNLILAGDIHTGLDNIRQVIKDASECWDRVLYVIGNHEYYRQDKPVFDAEVQKNLPENVTVFTDYKSVVIEDVTIHGCTLWGQVAPCDEVYVQFMAIRDYSVIKLNGGPLIVPDTNKWNREASEALKNGINESKSKKNIVITHHLPHPSLTDPRFKGDRAEGAFHSDQSSILDPNLNDITPDIWISGHTHSRFNKTIFNTICVNNSTGYPHERQKNIHSARYPSISI